MRGIDVEEKTVAEIKEHGEIRAQWVLPGYGGMLDRIVLMP